MRYSLETFWTEIIGDAATRRRGTDSPCPRVSASIIKAIRPAVELRAELTPDGEDVVAAKFARHVRARLALQPAQERFVCLGPQIFGVKLRGFEPGGIQRQFD